jgi:hypothetical protein
MVLSIQNFRDYLSVVPVTYVLTDSQPVCWAPQTQGGAAQTLSLVAKNI